MCNRAHKAMTSPREIAVCGSRQLLEGFNVACQELELVAAMSFCRFVVLEPQNKRLKCFLNAQVGACRSVGSRLDYFSLLMDRSDKSCFLHSAAIHNGKRPKTRRKKKQVDFKC